jgi:DNA topoisomerase-1
VETSLTRSQETKNIGSTKGRLVPTSIGLVVTDFLDEHFSQIMDYQFTANVEEEFDHIADGELKWQSMIKKFYRPFHDTVVQVADGAERASGERILGDDPKT